MSAASRDPGLPGASCQACERAINLDRHENAAGLPRIAYRIGTYGRFLDRMRTWISRQMPIDTPDAERPLAGLTTRAADDPALALMDAWACALDVLTFYQERLANEGFLRTATERRSVLELARSIGYELSPGVSASTRLAFTLLDTEKAPAEVPLSAGLQVQSVPGPGELPQTFETIESLTARPAWNAMRPAQRAEQVLAREDDQLYLAGLSTGLREGSKLLIVGRERLASETSNAFDFRTVVGLEPDKASGTTRVRLDKGIGWSGFGGTRSIEAPSEPRVYAFAKRATVFGHSAPDPRMFGASMKQELKALLNGAGDEWADFALGQSVRIHLAPEVPEIVPGGWLVFEDADYSELYRVKEVEAAGKKAFSLSLRTTRVTLDTKENLHRFEPRTLTVHAVSKELPLATRPLEGAIEGSEIVLDQLLTPLEPGRAVIVRGPEHGAGADAPRQVEVAIVQRTTDETRFGFRRSVLTLTAPLSLRFDRARAEVLGNVVRANHGKTVAREVLGSGDGSAKFQSFTLRQAPVTHTSTDQGVRSSLTLRVGGVAWTPVSSTFGLGPEARVYVARVDDDGVTRIQIGDGQSGARLPTGSENVTASYRVGLGSSGAVQADKLSMLKTRPQGVKAVTNPLPARGAADPETLAGARSNAPVTVLTLDRLVSVRDYQDYARAYAGIGKAQAVKLWDGRRYWVHLTLATSEGTPLGPNDMLYKSLTADIDARRDPIQRVIFDTFSPRSFKLRGRVRVDPAYVPQDVIDSIKSALRSAFAFSERDFAQVVTGAEIFAIAHRTPGVVAVDLDALWLDGDPEPLVLRGAPATWILGAHPAYFAPGGIERAELLLLDAADQAIDLTEAGP